MFILPIGTSLFAVLPLRTASPIISKIVKFFHSFVDSCIGTICHHKDFTGRVLLWEHFISPRNNLFHKQKSFFSGKVQIPNWAPFAPNGTANQIAGNPGTTVVSIGHLIPWPENTGYRTQVWDNITKPPRWPQKRRAYEISHTHWHTHIHTLTHTHTHTHIYIATAYIYIYIYISSG